MAQNAKEAVKICRASRWKLFRTLAKKNFLLQFDNWLK